MGHSSASPANEHCKSKSCSTHILWPTLALILLIPYSFVATLSVLKTWERKESKQSKPTINMTDSKDFWITQHMRWHDRNMNNSNTRKLVFRVYSYQGLGDSMKALHQLYSYAVLTRRILLIDWTEPYPIQSMMSERARRRFIYRPEIHGVEGDGKDYKFRWNQTLPMRMQLLLAGNSRMVFFHTSQLQCPKGGEWVLCEVGDYERVLRGKRWGNSKLPPYDRPIFRLATKIMLEPSIELVRRERNVQSKLRLCAYKPRAIQPSCTNRSHHYHGVHARLGFSGTNEKAEMRFLTTKGKDEQVAYCLARALEPYARSDSPVVFVASDKAEWRPLFRRIFLEHKPKARVVFYDAPGTHYRNLRNHAAMMQTHVESMLLSQAKNIVSLRSGFAVVSDMRGDSEHFNMLRPSQCIH